MRVDLNSGFESNLQAVKCCGRVKCYCLPPRGSQLRHEDGGGVGWLWKLLREQ